MPDSVLSRNVHMGDTNTSVDMREQRFNGLTSPFPGSSTPAGK